jgi:hypothetical protein
VVWSGVIGAGIIEVFGTGIHVKSRNDSLLTDGVDVKYKGRN